MQNTKLKQWYAAAAYGLLNSVLLLLVLNLGLYAVILTRRWVTYLTPIAKYGTGRTMQAYPGWRKEDVETLFRETYREPEYEPYTGFREKPFRGTFVNVDPAGFRLSKDQAPWPPRPEAINVFVFGGSTAFGFGLPDDETIASYLQECAPTNHSPGRRLAVYNFGRPNYFSNEEMILYQELLAAGFVPQVAVFIDGLNDFWKAGRPAYADRLRRFMEGKPESGPFDNVPMIQAAYWLGYQWAQRQPQKLPNYADPAILESVIARWLANKKITEAIADRFGVRAIFVWQPVPFYEYDLRYHLFYYSMEAFHAFVRSMYGYPLMENLRAQGKLGPNVLWLADMQRDKHENLYVDGVHYNAPFSKEIAGQICRCLRESPGDRQPQR